ncbi:hypothetical protein STEG23_010223 [Scotinomys teguina]
MRNSPHRTADWRIQQEQLARSPGLLWLAHPMYQTTWSKPILLSHPQWPGFGLTFIALFATKGPVDAQGQGAIGIIHDEIRGPC